MKTLLTALAAVLATASAAHAYDEFEPRSRRPPVVQEQGRSQERAPLQKYELIVKNRSSYPIVAIYAKSVRMENFSVDLIPRYSVEPGRQGLVNLYDGGGSCDWVIKTEDTQGNVARKTMDVCSSTVLTITD